MVIRPKIYNPAFDRPVVRAWIMACPMSFRAKFRVFGDCHPLVLCCSCWRNGYLSVLEKSEIVTARGGGLPLGLQCRSSGRFPRTTGIRLPGEPGHRIHTRPLLQPTKFRDRPVTAGLRAEGAASETIPLVGIQPARERSAKIGVRSNQCAARCRGQRVGSNCARTALTQTAPRDVDPSR